MQAGKKPRIRGRGLSATRSSAEGLPRASLGPRGFSSRLASDCHVRPVEGEWEWEQDGDSGGCAMWREPQAGARKGKRIRRPPGTTHSEIVHAPLQGRRRPARRPPPFLVQCLFATFHSVVSAASACCAVPALLSFPASVVRRPSLASPRRASLSYIIPHSFLVLLTASFPYFFLSPLISAAYHRHSFLERSASRVDPPSSGHAMAAEKISITICGDGGCGTREPI